MNTEKLMMIYCRNSVSDFT